MGRQKRSDDDRDITVLSRAPDGARIICRAVARRVAAFKAPPPPRGDATEFGTDPLAEARERAVTR